MLSLRTRLHILPGDHDAGIALGLAASPGGPQATSGWLV